MQGHVIPGNLSPFFWDIVIQIWLKDKLYLIAFTMKAGFLHQYLPGSGPRPLE